MTTKRQTEEFRQSVELATCRYADFVPSMGVPVIASLGRPRRPLNFGVELVEEVGPLKPWGLMQIEDDDDFTERYVQRLEKIGVEKLARIFHAISAKYDGARLVLLCWEDVLSERRKPCHRRTWAEWWMHKVGGRVVPELSWMAGPGGEPVPVRELLHRW